MDIGEKLDILADAAKYDVSCSSSGSARANAGDWAMVIRAAYAIPGLPTGAVCPF